MNPCSPSPSKQRNMPLSPPQTGPSKSSSLFSLFSPTKAFARMTNAAQASPSRSMKLASVIMQAAANSAGGIAAGAQPSSRATSKYITCVTQPLTTGEVLRAVSRLDGIVGHQLSEETVGRKCACENKWVYNSEQVRFSTSIAMKRATTVRAAIVHGACLCDRRGADNALRRASRIFKSTAKTRSTQKWRQRYARTCGSITTAVSL